MSDFPPRIEKLREMIETTLPEAISLIEEVWVQTGSLPFVLERFWRVSIQDGPERLPTVVDVPDKLVLESTKTAAALVQRSSKVVLTPRRRAK